MVCETSLGPLINVAVRLLAPQQRSKMNFDARGGLRSQALGLASPVRHKAIGKLAQVRDLVRRPQARTIRKLEGGCTMSESRGLDGEAMRQASLAGKTVAEIAGKRSPGTVPYHLRQPKLEAEGASHNRQANGSGDQPHRRHRRDSQRSLGATRRAREGPPAAVLTADVGCPPAKPVRLFELPETGMRPPVFSDGSRLQCRAVSAGLASGTRQRIDRAVPANPFPQCPFLVGSQALA